jgi:hypothetical protein
MLRTLELIDVGPAPRLRIDLGSRLNVFAGDNGLGKSFVLEILWWALSGTWAGQPGWPRLDAKTPEIAVEVERTLASSFLDERSTNVESDGAVLRLKSGFDFSRQEWSNFPFHFSREPAPTLVFFARSDGSFGVWDPARNHYKLRPQGKIGINDVEAASNPATFRRPPAYQFSGRDLWDGLEDHDKTLCNGLIRDWVSWQQKQPLGAEGGEFDLLTKVLRELSPHPESVIRPTAPLRVFVDDTREFPTIDFGYGSVPVIHASAGMRRVLALAYLVVWSWHEHVAACRLLRREPVERVVFLMDEIENHLHPSWQRRIVGALMTVLNGLSPAMKSQVFLTTHAPLVMASLEPLFEPEQDKLFVFDLDTKSRSVSLEELPWAKQGDATDWLTSPTFDLRQARSIEAEKVIEDAEALMLGNEPAGLKTRRTIDAELRRVLPGDDPFWPRWIGAGEEPAA